MCYIDLSQLGTSYARLYVDPITENRPSRREESEAGQEFTFGVEVSN